MSKRNGVQRRGTTNRDVHGSPIARRRRKQWIMDEFGDGETVLCAFGCGLALTFETLTVDRYPVPGCKGGKYVVGNIRPACAPCNSSCGGAVRKNK